MVQMLNVVFIDANIVEAKQSKMWNSRCSKRTFLIQEVNGKQTNNTDCVLQTIRFI